MAYVDTEYQLKAADVVEVDFMVQHEELAHVFGARTGSQDNNFSLSVGKSGTAYNLVADYSFSSLEGRLQVPAGNVLNRRTTSRVGVQDRQVVRFDGQGAWTNNEAVYRGDILSTATSCLLFHLNGSPFAGASPFRGRIYSFRILRNGEVALDLLPYKRNGVCGFRDEKSGRFITSSVGELTGPELGRQMKYIKGDGLAYLNTGVRIGSNDRIDVEFMPISEGTMHVFGSRTSADSNNFTGSIAQSLGVWSLMVDFCASWCRQSVPLSSLMHKRVSVSASRSSRTVRVVGTDEVWEDANECPNEFTTPGDCYLCYISGSPFTSAKMFDGRLYSFSVTRNGVKRADLVPWQRGAEVGMRDLVSWEFIGNAAESGTFSAKEIAPGLMLLFR